MSAPASVITGRAARYELVDTIASGGMAKVYLGRARTGPDSAAPAPVAVKILHPHLAQDPDVVALFLDEARVAIRIDHPNVVQVQDVDMVGEDLVIIMEYVEGAALSTMIRTLRERGTPIPLAIVVRILVETLRGLHAAHDLTDDRGHPMRIVHRDVSPHNIMVGADGVARVMDFGIATSVGRLAQTRTDGGVRGKLQYLAPEQIHRKTPDRRVDIWAAGLVLWECLTGKRLFDAGTEAETIAETLRAPIPPPSTLRSEVPLGLDEICLRALEPDPARRFASAADFADALELESTFVPAEAAAVSQLVLEVDGDSLKKRRESFRRGPTAPVALPVRFEVAAAEPQTQAPTLASAQPRSQSDVQSVVQVRPRIEAPRSNKLALVLVAAVSLVIGGVAMKLAGPPAAQDPMLAEPPVQMTTAQPTPAQGTAQATTAEVASAQVASATPPAPDAAAAIELPSAPPTTARPSGKKRGPGARPAGSASGAGRPFMPAEL